MSSVYVIAKPSKKGTRFHVRWEEGRGKPVHLGVFATKRLADKKVEASLRLLAEGGIPAKNPAVVEAPPPGRTVADICDAWIARRIDVADNTKSHFRASVKAIKKHFGEDDPDSITPDDVADWISDQMTPTTKRTNGYAAGTIALRVRTLATILAFAKVTPNPARDPEVRKPKRRRKAYRMPNRRELAIIYEHLPDDVAACVALMEHGGLRVSEAITVRWSDWDHRKKRLVIPDSKTTAGERWVEQIDGRPVIPRRPDGVDANAKMFPGFTRQSVGGAMARACKRGGIGRFSPHNLRHLHASRMMSSGRLPVSELAVRLGHSSSQVTLGTYDHVLPPED